MKNDTVRRSVIRIAAVGLFMAMNVVLSSFGIPVPGGHLYLNDTVICLAALLLDPIGAFLAGGVGAFLGDMFFYPTPMFVSLVTHGVQALVISLIAHHTLKKHPVAASLIGVGVGAVIMVTGYTLGRAFVYANVETALLKLPFQILQASLGVVLGPLLYWKCGVKKLYEKTLK